jgi:hypothetical protein
MATKAINAVFSGRFGGNTIAGLVMALTAVVCGIYLFVVTKGTFYDMILIETKSKTISTVFSILFTLLVLFASYAFIFLTTQAYDFMRFIIGLVGTGIVLTLSVSLIWTEASIGFSFAVLFAKLASTYGSCTLMPTIVALHKAEEQKLILLSKKDDADIEPFDDSSYKHSKFGRR